MTRLSGGWKWALGAVVVGGIAALAARFFLVSPALEPAPVSLTNSSGAESASALQIGALDVTGTGCPKGGAVQKLERPELLEISFDAFALAPASEAGPRSAACRISLALTVPAGMALRMIGGEWSGLATIDPAGSARIVREHFVTGIPSPSKVQPLDAGFEGSFFLQDDTRDELSDPDSGWTACAAKPVRHIARASAELVAEGAETSLSLTFGRVFNLETQPCTAG